MKEEELRRLKTAEERRLKAEEEGRLQEELRKLKEDEERRAEKIGERARGRWKGAIGSHVESIGIQKEKERLEVKEKLRLDNELQQKKNEEKARQI